MIVQVRLAKEQAAEFDAWRETQFGAPSRSEAIRWLVADALKRKRLEPEPPRGNVQVAEAGAATRKRRPN